MIALLLSILSSSLIAWIFKILGQREIPMFPTIVVNYLVCALTGILHQGTLAPPELVTGWLPYALLLGALFIGTFYAMGLTAQQFSPAVTMISAKMSLAVTVVVAMLLWQERLNAWGWLGVALALISVPLVVYKPLQINQSQHLIWLFPAISFIGSALIDSLLNYLQRGIVPATLFPTFLGILFGTAGIIGLLNLAFSFRNTNWSLSILPAGIILGLINYASIYFLMGALQQSGWSSALLFTANNIGILLLTQAGSLLFFSEKLNNFNKIGIGAAITALVLLSLK